METNKNPNRIHPLAATAAVAVTLVSAVGIAAITGVLPKSHSTNAPVAAVSTNAETKTAAQPAPDAAPASASKLADSTIAAEKPVKKQSSYQEPSRTIAQNQQRYNAPVAQAPRCYDCGRVIAVSAITQPAQASGIGMVAGAVVGGVLGNQVGDGNGRKVATVAGALGGGYAGNEIEKRTRTNTTYQVKVRMEDGSIRNFSQPSAEGLQTGDRVKVVNGTLVERG